jgi:hypothetical protein
MRVTGFVRIFDGLSYSALLIFKVAYYFMMWKMIYFSLAKEVSAKCGAMRFCCERA